MILTTIHSTDWALLHRYRGYHLEWSMIGDFSSYSEF